MKFILGYLVGGTIVAIYFLNYNRGDFNVWFMYSISNRRN